jgi:glutamate-1-semialdehyde 2,1-aminomutase
VCDVNLSLSNRLDEWSQRDRCVSIFSARWEGVIGYAAGAMISTTETLSLSRRAHRAIPAGCHTYSKGDDQFPLNAPAFIVSGRGALVRDPDGNEFLDWGMGLRSVILGHAYPRVVEAVVAELEHGSNFTRPSPLETLLAEDLIDLIPCAEMVKLAKNGSDVTTASLRLARAATGRDLVVFPREHPFHSCDDWFIGTTAVDAGVPDAIKRLSLTVPYGDRHALATLFSEHPGEIAAVIMEPATDAPPPSGYLEAVRELTRREGAVLIFDEIITGFRWHEAGAQTLYGVTPDMATFGKALANGFAISALVGRREIMELGGLHHDLPRVFLLSATHGGETHSIAAARATIAEIKQRDAVGHIWRIGAELQRGLNEAARVAGVSTVAVCGGYPCSPVLSFDSGNLAHSAGLRTLFLQEMVAGGVLIPYVAPSLSHDSGDVDRTCEVAARAFVQVREVLDGAPLPERLRGPAVKPVFRRFNATEVEA